MMILLFLPVLIWVLVIYFKLAVRFKIIDRPNHRSSHSRITIRGGGIIFPLALLLQFITSGFHYPYYAIGLLIISIISFYDDVRPLSSKIRLLAHLVAVFLMSMQVGLLDTSWWLISLYFILVIGTMNAYNFMDGINGLTGAYSLIMVSSLFFINEKRVEFISTEWLIVCGLAILVFIFFNFRQKAVCFAGDVGSISIAYILIFFVTLLISKTQDIKYIGFFLVYGLDAVTTIIFRLIRRENIFQAHRSHFYQHLVNSKLWSHIAVSTVYAFFQLSINVFVIFSTFTPVTLTVFILVSGIITIGLRLFVEGRSVLIRSNG